MSFIATPATIEAAPEAARPMLEAVKKKMGSVPNLFRLVSTSPATLEGYLNFSGAMEKGTLPATTRTRIALAVGEANGCQYCLAAHSYIGQHMIKMTADEISANRHGTSLDAKAAAAVSFAVTIVQHRGNVGQEAVNAVKAAGYSDGEIVEIIGHVALNTLTNYVNEAFKTAIDFPSAAALKVA